MLMLANLAILATEIVFINLLKTNELDSPKKNEIGYGFNAVGYLLFNLAHWMFAYKYFKMSRQLPFKLARREVPRNVFICDKITNWILLSFNSIPPILYGVGAIGKYSA